MSNFEGTITVQVNDRVYEGRPISADLAKQLLADSKGNFNELTLLVVAATFGLDKSALQKMPIAIYAQLLTALSEAVS